jgi:hypothetical protein
METDGALLLSDVDADCLASYHVLAHPHGSKPNGPDVIATPAFDGTGAQNRAQSPTAEKTIGAN